MKTLTTILMASTFILCLSACSQTTSNCKHQALLNWLDANDHVFSLDKNMSADSAIIRVLTSVSDFNQQAGKSLEGETKKGDAVDLLNKVEAFNHFLSRRTEPINPIPLGDADKYYEVYRDARKAGDASEAVLFTFPKIIDALKIIWTPTTNQWIDTTWWQNKAFFIYPANYGSTGPSPKQTTAIIQFAKDTTDTSPPLDNWAVIPNRLYNFGDLKPPKIRISNPTQAPQ